MNQMQNGFQLFIFSHFLSCQDEDATIEERAEKILYYYPYTVDKEKQLYCIDTCETYIALSGKFSEFPCDTITTKEEIISLNECEPGIWIGIALPRKSRQQVKTQSFRFSSFSNVLGGYSSSKDNQEKLNNQSNSECTSVSTKGERYMGSTLIKQIYDFVALFTGKWSRRLEEQSIMVCIMQSRKALRKIARVEQSLKDDEREPTEKEECLIKKKDDTLRELERLSSVSPATQLRGLIKSMLQLYLPSINMHHPHTFQTLNCVHMVDLDTNTLLSVQYLMQLIESKYHGSIENTALIYGGHITWSSIDNKLMTKIYRVIYLNEEKWMRQWANMKSIPTQSQQKIDLKWKQKKDKQFLDFGELLVGNPIDSQILFGAPNETYYAKIYTSHSKSKDETKILQVFEHGDAKIILVSPDTTVNLKTETEQKLFKTQMENFRSSFTSAFSSEIERIIQALFKSYSTLAKASTVDKSSTPSFEAITKYFLINHTNERMKFSDGYLANLKEYPNLLGPKSIQPPPLKNTLDVSFGRPVLQAIDTIQSIFDETDEEVQEVMMHTGTHAKPEDNYWVTAKKSLGRQSILISDGKLAIPDISMYNATVQKRNFAGKFFP